MKKIVYLMFLFLIIFVFKDNTYTSELSGYDIMRKFRDRPNANDSRSYVKMTLINSRGIKRIKRYTFYRIDYNRYGIGSKSLFLIEEPSDAKGVIFLQWTYGSSSKTDDRWLYLPALKRVRRISGTATNNSFLGSDLSYEDLAAGNRSLDLDNHKFLKEETIDGRKCWVVEVTPKDRSYVYSKSIIWVSQKELIGVKTLLYDQNGNLLKTIGVSGICQIQNIWIHLNTEIKNVQENHTTLTERTVNDVKFNIGLNMNLFEVSSVEKGWVK